MVTHESYFASRAMQALEILAFGPATSAGIAAELQVHPRTARRLLNRMVYDGWLIRHEGPRPRYAATLRVVALAAQFAARQPLLERAVVPAMDLSIATGCPVHLAIPSYRSTVRLTRIDADGVDLTRGLVPANATAAGKLLLAYRSRWRDAVLAAPLHKLTERTLIDPVSLRAQLDCVRACEAAEEKGEYRLGGHAIAVPIPGDDAEPVAALAISWTDDTAPDADALRSLLCETATVIQRLGGEATHQ